MALTLRSLFSKRARLQQKGSLQCRLLNLPAEIRLHIYKLVACSQRAVVLHPRGDKGWRALKGSAIDSIKLLTLCKQIRYEAFNIVWENLRFVVLLSLYRPNEKKRYFKTIRQSVTTRNWKRLLTFPLPRAIPLLPSDLSRVLQDIRDITTLEVYVVENLGIRVLSPRAENRLHLVVKNAVTGLFDEVKANGGRATAILRTMGTERQVEVL